MDQLEARTRLPHFSLHERVVAPAIPCAVRQCLRDGGPGRVTEIQQSSSGKQLLAVKLDCQGARDVPHWYINTELKQEPTV